MPAATVHRIARSGVITLLLPVLIGLPGRRLGAQAPAPRDSVARADSLARRPLTLEPVRVKARRWKRPTVSENSAADAAGGQQEAGSLAIGLADEGNVAALGGTVATVALLPGAGGAALSFLGLPPAATATTLNGMAFAGTDIPRGLLAPARVGSSVFDVAQGGFSGGQLALRTYSGSVFTHSAITARVDQPLGMGGATPGATPRSTGVSLAQSGALRHERVFYNVAAQLDRSSLPTPSLGDAAAGRWPALAAGIAAEVLRALDSAGVPIGRARGAAGESTSGNVFLRLDAAPTARRTANVVAFGSWSDMRPVGMSPLATFSHGSARASHTVGTLAEHAQLLRGRYLAHTRLAVSQRQSRVDPLARLPEGRVLVPLASDSSAFETVAFGGAGAFTPDEQSTRLEARHDLSWYTAGANHRLRLSAQATREATRSAEGNDRFGRVLYQSLDDFRAGKAASYALDARDGGYAGTMSSAALALGDLWRPTGTLTLQYGVRLDADAVSGSRGAGSRAVAHSVFASPRIGFSWNYGSREQFGFGPRPAGTVHGGIGVFRGAHSAGELRRAAGSAAVATLTCVGGTTPSITWDSPWDRERLPTSCAAGDEVALPPSVGDSTTVAAGYRPSTSRRASIGWTGPITRALQLGVDVTASESWALAGVSYLGLPATPRFNLAQEGGRPMYVARDSIPANGLLGDAAYRGRTAQLRTDGRARAVQVAATLGPASFSPGDRFMWGASYAFTRANLRTAGFDATTSSDPRLQHWSRSPYAPTHRVTSFVGLRLQNGAFVSLGGQLQSGLPFTPIVATDVNGDGLANDVAFVPLGIDGPSCLRRQAGRLAGPGSCVAPAQASVNGMAFIPGALLRLPQRATVSVGFTNILAGADRLLHGRTTRGWGQAAAPDPVLLYPTGFDAARASFRYAVNGAFGGVRGAHAAGWSPFRITVDLRIPVSRPQQEQLLTQVLAPGRERPGRRLDPEQVKRRYKQFAIINPLYALVGVRDSLHLTPTQQEALDDLLRRYESRVDTIWDPVAQRVAAAGTTYDRRVMLAAVRAAQELAWDVLADAVTQARSLLTAGQLSLLDPGVAALLDPAAITRLRRTEFRL